jgi:hypothetical protein
MCPPRNLWELGVGDANCRMRLLFGHGEERPKRTRRFSGGIGEHDSQVRANLEIAKRFTARQECRGVAKEGKEMRDDGKLRRHKMIIKSFVRGAIGFLYAFSAAIRMLF